MDSTLRASFTVKIEFELNLLELGDLSKALGQATHSVPQYEREYLKLMKLLRKSIENESTKHTTDR